MKSARFLEKPQSEYQSHNNAQFLEMLNWQYKVSLGEVSADHRGVLCVGAKMGWEMKFLSEVRERIQF